MIKVNHISLVVSDAEKSRDFYMNGLGVKALNRPNFPNPGHWLWLGNVQLHLIQSPHAATEALHAPEASTGEVNHIAFEVSDFAAVEARLKELKWSFKKNRVPECGKIVQQLFLQDPDGHYVEICDCNGLDEFIFGPELDPEAIRTLSGQRFHGADVVAACAAATAALAFVPEGLALGNGCEIQGSQSYLQRAFKILSRGGENIEKDGLFAVLERMGVNADPDVVEKMMVQMDKGRSGRVAYKAFSKFMEPLLRPSRSNRLLLEAFSLLDGDKDGFVDENDLLFVLYGVGQRMDEEQLRAAIDAADADRDGRVSCEEFLQFMHGRCEEACARVIDGRLF